jgi:hypothetical protein
MMEMCLEVTGEISSTLSRIYKLSYTTAGIGCGYHSQFDLVCVVDLAGSYEDSIEDIQSKKNRSPQGFTKSVKVQIPDTPPRRSPPTEKEARMSMPLRI